MVPSNYPAEIENVLHMLSPDIVHLEQYMDFLRNRMFRQTLLCHANQNPNYSLRAEQLKSFHIASPAKPKDENPVLHTADQVLFETPDGITLHSQEPIVKAVMVLLAKLWPKTVPFMDLLAQARESLKAHGKENELKDDIAALSQAFLTFYASASTSLLELYLHPSSFITEITDKPEAWPLARLQAITHNRVTNLRHESIFLGEFERHLLRFADGTHQRQELVTLLTERVCAGELTVEQDGQAVHEQNHVHAMVGQAVDSQMHTMARSALVVR
jgi:methyltransferase-like protein